MRRNTTWNGGTWTWHDAPWRRTTENLALVRAVDLHDNSWFRMSQALLPLLFCSLLYWVNDCMDIFLARNVELYPVAYNNRQCRKDFVWCISLLKNNIAEHFRLEANNPHHQQTLGAIGLVLDQSITTVHSGTTHVMLFLRCSDTSAQQKKILAPAQFESACFIPKRFVLSPECNEDQHYSKPAQFKRNVTTKRGWLETSAPRITPLALLVVKIIAPSDKLSVYETEQLGETHDFLLPGLLLMFWAKYMKNMFPFAADPICLMEEIFLAETQSSSIKGIGVVLYLSLCRPRLRGCSISFYFCQLLCWASLLELYVPECSGLLSAFAKPWLMIQCIHIYSSQ